jgi:hypothetical protein
MEEVHDTLDNLLHETEHLDRIVGDGVADHNLELALSQAKRVRRAASITIKALAKERDKPATA